MQSLCDAVKEQFDKLNRLTPTLSMRFSAEWLHFEKTLNIALSTFFPDYAKNMSHGLEDMIAWTNEHKFAGVHLDKAAMEQLWGYNFHVARPDIGGGNCYSFNVNDTMRQTEPNLEGGLVIHLRKGQNAIRECMGPGKFDKGEHCGC